MTYSSHHQKRSRLALGILSGLIGIVAIGCNQPAVIAPAETEAADTKADRQAKAPDTEVDPADAYIKDEYDTSEIDPADACIRNECDFSVSPRRLSSAELNAIHEEISPDDSIISDQSFAITLPYIGSAEFIATESKADRLSLRLRTDRDEYQYIYESSMWSLWNVKAVAFEDIHKDGDGPDIIVIAEYVTGIGPDGAQPFPVATVFFNRGDDTFQEDASVNQILSDRNVATVSEVIEIAQTEGLVRGLQYREGP